LKIGEREKWTEGGRRKADRELRAKGGGRRTPQLNTLQGNPVQRGREGRGREKFLFIKLKYDIFT